MRVQARMRDFDEKQREGCVVEKRNGEGGHV